MSEALVLTEKRGRVLIITINRPQSRNALTYETSFALADAIDELENNDELSLVSYVVKGIISVLAWT